MGPSPSSSKVSSAMLRCVSSVFTLMPTNPLCRAPIAMFARLLALVSLLTSETETSIRMRVTFTMTDSFFSPTMIQLYHSLRRVAPPGLLL